MDLAPVEPARLLIMAVLAAGLVTASLQVDRVPSPPTEPPGLSAPERAVRQQRAVTLEREASTLLMAWLNGDRSVALPEIRRLYGAAEAGYGESLERYPVQALAALTRKLEGDPDWLSGTPRWEDRLAFRCSFEGHGHARLASLVRDVSFDDDSYAWSTEPNLLAIQLLEWAGFSEGRDGHAVSVVGLLEREVGLRPGMKVGEVGGGVWGLAYRVAERIGPRGELWGNELHPDLVGFLGSIEREARARGIPLARLHGVLATPTEPGFPRARLDLVIINNTFHAMAGRPAFEERTSGHRAEIAKLVEYLGKLRVSLADGGRLAIVDFYPSEERIRSIVERAGFRFLSSTPLTGPDSDHPSQPAHAIRMYVFAR